MLMSDDRGGFRGLGGGGGGAVGPFFAPVHFLKALIFDQKILVLPESHKEHFLFCSLGGWREGLHSIKFSLALLCLDFLDLALCNKIALSLHFPKCLCELRI